MANRIKIFLLIIFWVWSCNGGFSQSFFTNPVGSCVAEGPVELGLKFTTSSSATISALRFFKCRNDNNPYEMKLYGNGNFIKAVVFQGPQTGWVSVPVSINISPGINYVVSYYSPGGFYQAISTYAYPIKNGPLTATGSVYKYGGGYPTLSYQTSNYFADVVLQSAPPSPAKDTIYIHDTTRLPAVHDTLRIHDSTIIFKNIFIALHDTTTIHDTIWMTGCKDTTFALVTFDAYDSTNYQKFFDNFFEVEYFTLPNGKIWRFKAELEKRWYKEERLPDGTWLRLPNQ